MPVRRSQAGEGALEVAPACRSRSVAVCSAGSRQAGRGVVRGPRRAAAGTGRICIYLVEGSTFNAAALMQNTSRRRRLATMKLSGADWRRSDPKEKLWSDVKAA